MLLGSIWQHATSPLRSIIWEKVFKSGISTFCGIQPLKNFGEYGVLKETVSLKIL